MMKQRSPPQIFFSLICFFASLIRLSNAACYNSTFDVLVAQVSDPRGNDVQKVYELCPDATIQIGVPTDSSFSDFQMGDYPLGVIRPNVTIEGNGATLVGGVYQLVTLPVFQFTTPDNQTLTFAAPKDNMIVRNLNLMGPLVYIPGFSAESIFLSGPGKGILFENIQITGLRGDYCRAISFSSSILPGLAELTPPSSIEATMNGLSISDVSIGNHTPTVFVTNQTLSITKADASDLDAGAFFTCYGPLAVCSIADSCITNSTFGSSSLRTDGNGEVTTMTATNVYTSNIDAEECPTELLADNKVLDDGLLDCVDLPTADTCALDPTEPPTNAPTEAKTDPATDAPSGTPTSAAVSASVTIVSSAFIVVIATSGLVLY